MMTANVDRVHLQAQGRYLRLQHQEQTITLNSRQPLALLGRNPANELVVNNGFASRLHARVVWREGRFYLRDQSRNGTFVLTSAGEVYLHDTEVVLEGSGLISLGCPLDQEGTTPIHYSCLDRPAGDAAAATDSTMPELTVGHPRAPKTLPPLLTSAAVPDLNLVAVLESLLDEDVMVVVLGSEGQVCYLSPTCVRLLGFTAQDCLGRDFLGFIHPQDQQRFLDIWTRLQLRDNLESQTLELRVFHRNLNWRVCICRLQHLPEDNAMGGVALHITDISESRPEGQPAADGILLAGRYQLGEVLATGGFSQTFLAQDVLRPGHPHCVVKQLRPNPAAPREMSTARRLFTAEAEILEKLGRHPQIPQLLAYLEEEDTFYLVLDYIHGWPLRDEMERTAAFSEHQIVELLRDVLGILEFIHGQQVIHRDLKPENLIRRAEDGRLVLIDFGSVKRLRTALSGSLRPITISVGTPGYVAPEQILGRPNVTSDLYALGMIALEALTGVAPSQFGEDPFTGEIILPTTVPIPPELEAFLMLLVRRDWQARFPTAREALKALQNLATSMT